MSIRKSIVVCAAAFAAAAAVSSASAAEEARSASAAMHNQEGQPVGQVSLEDTPSGVLIAAEFTGLPEGARAFHIHAVGQCEAPFTSAGGHFNPDGKKHGIKSAEGKHAGDLPNLHVPASGELKVELFAVGLTVDALFDDDGSALVVHAGPDDYETDPTGNAGDRIACGVVSR